MRPPVRSPPLDIQLGENRASLVGFRPGFRVARHVSLPHAAAMQTIRIAFPVVAALLLAVGCDRPSSPPPAPTPPAPTEPASTTAATTVTNADGTTPEMQRLKGRWLRPDGGYVIEIKEVLASGKLSAAYYNPRSINVSQAEVRKDAGAVKVFIELRDQNYPGATYNLTFDPEHDMMAGPYYQPLAGETYQVQFERLKDEGR